jgi:Fe-S cluster biogenesis protein NfuA
MFIQTEDTPNPDTLKFLPGKILLDQGTLEFKTKKEASSNNFASILFEDRNVKSVFIGKDFVTITKNKNVDWESIKPKILSKILEFFSLGEPINNVEEKQSQKNDLNYNDKDQKIVEQIKKLIDERVKPAVAQDGGDISFVKFNNGKVFLELRGACSGCPSSTITLKSGIENMLKYYIPEITSVEAINQ